MHCRRAAGSGVHRKAPGCGLSIGQHRAHPDLRHRGCARVPCREGRRCRCARPAGGRQVHERVRSCREAGAVRCALLCTGLLLIPEVIMGPTAGRPRNRAFHVLFLCTHNSTRSILAECIMNRLGAGKFRAYSAGSQPSGKVHPFALELLGKLNHETSNLRSKSWSEFEGADTPALDFVFTVCDDAANEVCPVWPGQPMTAHWGLPDPSRAEGNEAERRLAFADTYRMLNQRIGIFVSLPFKSLDALSLQKRLDEIGRTARHVSREKA